MTPDDLAAALADDPLLADVEFVVLHGSRARGDARPGSDWDVGVLAGRSPDLAAITSLLVGTLGTEAIDVVDLRTASGLLRFRVARDGVLLVERVAGAFVEFQLDAVQFWCDAGSVIRAAQADVLAALP